MMNICDYHLCTGCATCMNVYPHKAISMQSDKYGELHPVVDMANCVGCGLCINRCPVNQDTERLEPRKCLAVWEKSLNDRKYSASGGVAAALYRTVVSAYKGIGYGVEWGDELKAHFVRANEYHLDALKGSKYVQAIVDNIYGQVKMDLYEKRTVLFIGLPCQIAGLKNYLHKEYANLITCDLLCHGVPPQDYLVKEIKSLIPSKHLKDITNCRFRGNDKYNYWLTLWNGDKLLYGKKAVHSYYLTGFLTSITLRESCYHCKYSDRKRVADITIGDFLGLGELQSHNGTPPKNISVVTLNSDKGVKFWDKVKSSSLQQEERAIDEAVSGGGSFRNCATRNPKREQFLYNYEKYGWKKAIRKSLWKSILKAKIQSVFNH